MTFLFFFFFILTKWPQWRANLPVDLAIKWMKMWGKVKEQWRIKVRQAYWQCNLVSLRSSTTTTLHFWEDCKVCPELQLGVVLFLPLPCSPVLHSLLLSWLYSILYSHTICQLFGYLSGDGDWLIDCLSRRAVQSMSIVGDDCCCSQSKQTSQLPLTLVVDCLLIWK